LVMSPCPLIKCSCMVAGLWQERFQVVYSHQNYPIAMATMTGQWLDLNQDKISVGAAATLIEVHICTGRVAIDEHLNP